MNSSNISRNKPINLKKYEYELLENGFSNQDIKIGKRVLASKKLLWDITLEILKNLLQKKLERSML